MMNKENINRLVLIFDSLFIMILCFVTLLAVMLFQGKIIVDYNINFITLGVVVITSVSFITFIILQSNKELHNIIENHDWENNGKDSNQGDE